MSSYLDLTVRQFLGRLAARTPAPGGGGAAAITTAMAAGLVAMAARFSATQLADAADLALLADKLRERAAALADADAGAYRAVLDAYALPASTDARPRRIREALRHAAAVPLEIAEIAAEVAALAARLAREGNKNLRGDAVTAAQLAGTAAVSAACLVDINVGLGDLEPGTSRSAARAASAAAKAASQAAATVSPRKFTSGEQS